MLRLELLIKEKLWQSTKLPEMVFCYQNCSDLLWEKIVLVIDKNFEIRGWMPRICKNFEIIRTIYSSSYGLRTPCEEIVFTARPKINSHSQIFRYGWYIFCLPHRPKFSDSFDLWLHWVSVVCGTYHALET